MRRHLAILTMTLSLTTTGAPAAAQTPGPERPADAAAIRAHIESIFQAFVDKDRTKLESGGQTRSEHGMATEVFVLKEGAWLNTGWQLAPVTK